MTKDELIIKWARISNIETYNNEDINKRIINVIKESFKAGQESALVEHHNKIHGEQTLKKYDKALIQKALATEKKRTIKIIEEVYKEYKNHCLDECDGVRKALTELKSKVSE